ncbi:MAG: hypothetical protein FDX02_04520 [Chlorobium sp.]|nr:MAG: hypothetical protein FDX02_04520 [Chlorobium sp.]
MDIKRVTILAAGFLTLAAPAALFSAEGTKSFSLDYTRSKDIAPSSFTVKAGEKVRLEVNPTDTATGCMSDIMVPGLVDKPQPLIKGKKVVMEFTPQKPGAYKITCAMGVPRGVINVR